VNDLMCKGLPFRTRVRELGAEESEPGLVVRIHSYVGGAAIILLGEDGVQPETTANKKEPCFPARALGKNECAKPLSFYFLKVRREERTAYTTEVV
jgi:hypothetical protein